MKILCIPRSTQGEHLTSPPKQQLFHAENYSAQFRRLPFLDPEISVAILRDLSTECASTL